MNSADFLAFKYTIYNYASEMSNILYDNASIGKKSVNEDFVRLKALLVYIGILNDYDLDQDNMFDDTEMEIVINHINKLCGTNYNIDFDAIEDGDDS